MRAGVPDFKVRSAAHQAELGEEGVRRLFDAGSRWDLAPALRAGGAVVFPHATIGVCGHQIAAAVSACIGTRRVLAIGVLHALTQELDAARVRVVQGADPALEPTWGVQGPGRPGREDWRDEFSLSHFQFLWEQAARRAEMPELIVRYPYLAGGRPDLLPGIEELQEIAQDAVVVATMDPFHHGIGYGEPEETAVGPEAGGLTLARNAIMTGFELLRAGDYGAFNQHCVKTKSDGRDVGQVLRYVLGPQSATILDLVTDDMSGPYNKPAPTWVAGALIRLDLV